MEVKERLGRAISKTSPSPGLASRILKHAATVIAMSTAFILYAGHTYYDVLFRSFGLRASLLELGQIELGVAGFNAILVALFDSVRQAVPFWIYAIPTGVIILVLIAIVGRHHPKFRQVAAWIDQSSPLVSRIGLLGTLFALACMSFVSGHITAISDAHSLRSMARVSPLCYSTETSVYRGRLIGQSATITVIKRAEDTALVSTGDIIRVADCPRKSPGQAGAS